MTDSYEVVKGPTIASIKEQTSLASNCNTLSDQRDAEYIFCWFCLITLISLIVAESRDRTRLGCPLMNAEEIPPPRYCFTQNYKYGKAACDRATVWLAVCTQVRQNAAR